MTCYCILFQVKRTQELENKASALKREVEILRASARQHKEKMQQLHELLASKEEMHRYTSTMSMIVFLVLLGVTA